MPKKNNSGATSVCSKKTPAGDNILGYFADIENDIRSLMKNNGTFVRELNDCKNNADSAMRRTLLKWLDIADAFERMFANIEPRLGPVDSQTKIWVGNFRAVHRLLLRSLKEFGVVVIEVSIGTKADSSVHNVVEVIQDPQYENEVIVSEIGKGYMWKALFPLSLDKILILTNLSWVRNPYGHPRKARPNFYPFRNTIFNFTQIQTGRMLNEVEVNEINYVIKNRAYRYVAAARKEWLYPENKIPSQQWGDLGQGYLFMPDPRSVTFSSEVIIGYDNKRADIFDEYGRKPWHPDYNNKSGRDKEWLSFHAFQGEFARVFGSKRRGSAFEFGNIDHTEDSPDYHAYHLRLEKENKQKLGINF